MPSLTSSNQAPRLIPDASVSIYRGLDTSQISHVSFLITFNVLSYRSWYILFHPHLTLMSVFTMVCTLLQSLVRTYFSNSVYPEMTNSFLGFGGDISVSTCTFLGSRFTPCQIISPRNGKLVHLKRHLSLLSFKFAYLHILKTLSYVALWSLYCSSKPALKMSSSIPKTLGIPQNNSSIVILNMFPTGATHDGNHMYLSNGQENVVNIDMSKMGSHWTALNNLGLTGSMTEDYGASYCF